MTLRCVRWLTVLALALGTICGAMAMAPAAPDADPELEAKVHRISQELRCLVCQNQTIADSNAELAQDLRREVRQRLAKGDSEDEVRRFMVERYGDFVLYRPPFQATTLALWLGPFALLVVGLWVARRIIVARRAHVPLAPSLTSEEQARLQALIGKQEHGTR
jgi:cytochrome c-type biogenesis protein CcmH